MRGGEVGVDFGECAAGARANFAPDATVILPSGKKISGAEAQAFSSLYAPDNEEGKP